MRENTTRGSRSPRGRKSPPRRKTKPGERSRSPRKRRSTSRGRSRSGRSGKGSRCGKSRSPSRPESARQESGRSSTRSQRSSRRWRESWGGSPTSRSPSPRPARQFTINERPLIRELERRNAVLEQSLSQPRDRIARPVSAPAARNPPTDLEEIKSNLDQIQRLLNREGLS